MKTAKKALLLVLCGCLLVAAGIIGTMAYFTDQEAVTNTFTVGQVKISLDEALTDEYGVVQGNERIPNETSQKNGNEYKIIPGHTYVKDPTVTVLADSEESYVRMLVKVDNIAQLAKIFPADGYYSEGVFLLQNLCVDKKGKNTWNPDVWKFEKFTEETSTYEFRYYKTVNTLAVGDAEPKDLTLEPLFSEFTIPGTVVTEDNIKYFVKNENNEDSKVAIHITAQAIQADGFEADAEKNLDADDVAWAAFDAQNNK